VYLLLGGAAVYRCDNWLVLSAASAAEVTQSAQNEFFHSLLVRGLHHYHHEGIRLNFLSAEFLSICRDGEQSMRLRIEAMVRAAFWVSPSGRR